MNKLMFVTKASDCDFFCLEVIDATILELYEQYGDFIISDNPWYGLDAHSVKDFYNCPLAIANEIIKCELELIIYDDYVE